MFSDNLLKSLLQLILSRRLNPVWNHSTLALRGGLLVHYLPTTAFPPAPRSLGCHSESFGTGR